MKVKDSYRFRSIHGRKGLRKRLISSLDSASGWIAAAVIGTLTACVAYIVDVAEATASDWKFGYCKSNPFINRDACCGEAEECSKWHTWAEGYGVAMMIYVSWALLFGIVSSSATMLTRKSLPAASSGSGDKQHESADGVDVPDVPVHAVLSGKSMYMAAGSGIPEIKTILSGFVIPHFLDLKVLIVKGFGAIFAVATGMCLGKEGPFVHIATSVGYLVANRIPKYRNNGRKMRELLSAACASGLSVAFGAPIGGVLFSYEVSLLYIFYMYSNFVTSLVTER